jgi:hypothetical protein
LMRPGRPDSLTAAPAKTNEFPPLRVAFQAPVAIARRLA